MKLRKDLVDELIRLTREYYKTREESLLKKLEQVEKVLMKECGVSFLIIHVIDLIEDLAKFSVFAKGITNEDIYKALEVFGVIVE